MFRVPWRIVFSLIDVDSWPAHSRYLTQAAAWTRSVAFSLPSKMSETKTLLPKHLFAVSELGQSRYHPSLNPCLWELVCHYFLKTVTIVWWYSLIFKRDKKCGSHEIASTKDRFQFACMDKKTKLNGLAMQGKGFEPLNRRNRILSPARNLCVLEFIPISTATEMNRKTIFLNH
jgi:hypothetical protein